ncbi:MAG: hypothetical protein ACFFGP_16000, partial [Promethearchaeota archaeon]
MEAEKERDQVLSKIKELGSIDIDRIKAELDLSEGRLLCNIDYLKELGLLEFVGEKPRFFAKYIKKSEI